MDKMREEFEQWFEDDSFPLEANWFKKDDDGDYCLTSTDFAWEGWKASRATLCVELPCSLGYPNNDMVYLSDVEERLEKAGVSYK